MPFIGQVSGEKTVPNSFGLVLRGSNKNDEVIQFQENISVARKAKTAEL